LLPFVQRYDQLLSSLQIEHKFAVIPGAQHRYNEIIEKAHFDALAFWKTAFEAK
jgi:hypothetical protein